MDAVLAMINRRMSTHSLWEEKVPSNLDLSSSFSWFFYIHISAARAIIVLRFSKNASAPQETVFQISCINYKNKKYLGNYFSAVKYAFVKLWLYFFLHRTLCTSLLLPYAELLCSSATPWIAKLWTIFSSLNCLLLDITSPSYNVKELLRVFRLRVGLPAKSLAMQSDVVPRKSFGNCTWHFLSILEYLKLFLIFHLIPFLIIFII